MFGAWVGTGLGRGGVDFGVVMRVGVVIVVCVGVVSGVIVVGGSCCL